MIQCPNPECNAESVVRYLHFFTDIGNWLFQDYSLAKIKLVKHSL